MMRTKKILWALSLAIGCYSAMGLDLESERAAKPGKRKRLVHIYKVNDDAAWLRFNNGGKVSIFPPLVIGVRKIESNGFRFIPAKEAPEGMMSQEFFERVYRYNSLVNEVFIPYSDIKSVRVGYASILVKIRMKDGKKYKIKCLWPKKVAREIRSHLSVE